MGLGQLAAGHPAVIILLQCLQADRAKDLLRGGEPGQQPLKIIGAFNAPAEFVREHRFSRARRPDDEDVIGRQKSGQRSVNQIGPFEKGLSELVADFLELFGACHGLRFSKVANGGYGHNLSSHQIRAFPGIELRGRISLPPKLVRHGHFQVIEIFTVTPKSARVLL